MICGQITHRPRGKLTPIVTTPSTCVKGSAHLMQPFCIKYAEWLYLKCILISNVSTTYRWHPSVGCQFSVDTVFSWVTSVFSSATSFWSLETAVVSWETAVYNWETVVASWLSTCSLPPRLLTSQSWWITSYVDCDDVRWMTVVTNRLICRNVAAILDLIYTTL